MDTLSILNITKGRSGYLRTKHSSRFKVVGSNPVSSKIIEKNVARIISFDLASNSDIKNYNTVILISFSFSY